ncbi:ribonuclease H-like domain-containing protein, partial [Tanacetum coccineum]
MVLNSPCFTVKSWLVQDKIVPVQKQTAFHKDKSNPLIVDSLLKTIRLSIHLVVYNEELAILEQTATGKGISNPLMAGSFPKTTKPTDVKCFEPVFPFKDSASKTVDASNVFQDLNHINFFDNEYPEMPYDDERVYHNQNSNQRSQSDSSHSSVPDGDMNTVTKLEENINSEGNLDQNPSVFAQDSQNLRRSSIQSVLLRNYNDFVMDSKSDKDVFLALLVYVDDVINIGNNVSEIDKFKVFLKSKFMIKDLGKLKYFLGIEVINTDKGIYLNQKKYVLDLLSEYGMLACKPAKTPLMSKLVISSKATDNDHILDNIIDYQKLMGKLIYLTNTRPDISYDVHCLSQFTHSPLKSHLKIAFKILRYLKSYPGLGIHFIKNS